MKPLLPRLIGAHLTIIAIYTVLVMLLPFPEVYLVVVATLIAAPLGSAIATGYLIRMWVEDPYRPRSELFGFLAYGAFVLTLSLLLVGALAVLRIIADIEGDSPYLSPEVTTAVLGLSFMLVGSVPIMKGILFYRFNKGSTSAGLIGERVGVPQPNGGE